MKERFYQLTNVSEDSATLYIYGDITSIKWFENDVCVYDLAKEIGDLNGKALTVRINSYGGEVAEGPASYKLLNSYVGEVFRSGHDHLRWIRVQRSVGGVHGRRQADHATFQLVDDSQCMDTRDR